MTAKRNKETDSHPLTRWMDRTKVGPSELASMLGVSVNLLHRWRSCERAITEEYLEALVKISNGRLTMPELIKPFTDKIRRKRREYREQREAERLAKMRRHP